MPIVTLIGAGSAEFTQQLVSDLLQGGAVDLEVRLMDLNRDRLAGAEALVRALADLSGQTVRISAHTDLKEALAGTHYAVNTVLAGGREAVRRDFAVLDKFGLRQTVGDTLGVAGVMRAVRTVPAVLEMVRAMEAVAPDAVFLNYTNPMSMIMMAIDQTSAIEHYGLCHSVQATVETLAEYLEVPQDELEWTSAGINHMAWMLSLRHHGEDLYPRLWEKSRDPHIWQQDPVRFELMKMFGKFVTESSKHNAEYTAYFIAHDSEVEKMGIPLNEYLTRPFHPMPEPSAAELFEPSGEYAPLFILHREHKTAWTFYGNVANRGLIDNLPASANVEVPCRMERGGVRPEPVGSLPLPLAALNRQAINLQELAVWGILHREREAIYQAAALDPQAAGRLTLDAIRSLVDELLAANGSIIPPMPRQWRMS